MRDASKLLAVLLLLLAVGGCGKKNSEPEADPATITCAANLRLLDQAKRNWAQQHNAALTDTPTAEDLQPYIRGALPVCPSGGTYTIGTVADLPSCSIAAHNDYFRAHLNPEQQPPAK